LQVATSVVRLTIKLEGLYCQWETIQRGQWHVAASDRATQSYISVGGMNAFTTI
jgi:alpha-glucosidase